MAIFFFLSVFGPRFVSVGLCFFDMISECWFSHLLFYVRNILISGYLFTFLAYCASMFRVLFLQLTLSQWIGVFSGWWIDFGGYLKLCSLVYPKTATQNYESMPLCVDGFISYYVLKYLLFHSATWRCITNYPWNFVLKKEKRSFWTCQLYVVSYMSSSLYCKL